MSTFLIANQLTAFLRAPDSSSPLTQRWLCPIPNAPVAGVVERAVVVAGREVAEERAAVEPAEEGLEGVVAAAELAVGPEERAAVEKAVREGGLAVEERAAVAPVVERAAAE